MGVKKPELVDNSTWVKTKCFMAMVLLIQHSVLWAVLDAAVVTEYWNDHTVVPPFTDFIIVPSQLACIHRCKNWKHCNIVAISSTNSSDSGLSCLMSWMECYEGYHSRLTRAHGWDVYAFRNKGGLPFILSFRFNRVKMCTMIHPSNGYLVLTYDCFDWFCSNSLHQIFHVATKKCLTLEQTSNSGGYLSLSSNCVHSPAIREVDQGVQLVQSQWHLHPEDMHENPPPGMKVTAWHAGKHWFYFKYRDYFF